MAADRDATMSSPVVRPRLLPALKGVTALLATLVLVQAILAGRGWFIDFDLIAIHGYVGMSVLLIAVLQMALVVRAGVPGSILFVSAAILGLIITQIGLGYASRDSALAASLHIPNGVLIYGLASSEAVMVFRLRG